MSGFDFRMDADGVAVVTMDMPGQPVNLMNDAYVAYMTGTLAAIRAAAADGALKGVVLTSAKKTFFAGGDIAAIMRYQAERAWEECFSALGQMKAQLLELESVGVPIAAAINGAALGGGIPTPRPPSTPRIWPVVQPDSSLKKYRTAAAISAGSPIRPNGCIDTDAASSASLLHKPFDNSVRVSAGATALTRMP